jgi:hypothetical protein
MPSGQAAALARLLGLAGGGGQTRTPADVFDVRTPGGGFTPAPYRLPGSGVSPWGNGRTDLPPAVYRSAAMKALMNGLWTAGLGFNPTAFGRQGRLDSFYQSNPWAQGMSRDSMRDIHRWLKQQNRSAR